MLANFTKLGTFSLCLIAGVVLPTKMMGKSCELVMAARTVLTPKKAAIREYERSDIDPPERNQMLPPNCM